MRVGVVTKWFNRGQPVVGRYLRSAVDSLGHRSFVLAKPRREKGPMAGALERTGVWDQPGVTAASSFETPLSEYMDWIEANSIEAILCDQNYQFEELAQIRQRGVRTIGRFVWEHFTAEHLAGAEAAYDVIYSVTRAEQERYRGWGLDTPRVPWGIHPELLAVTTAGASSVGSGSPSAGADPSTPPSGGPRLPSDTGSRGETTAGASSVGSGSASAGADPSTPPSGGPRLPSDTGSRGESAELGGGIRSQGDGIVRFVFPGGFLGHRKPAEPVIEAFSQTTNPDLRLLVKAQVERSRLQDILPMVEADPRIELLLADQPWEEHLATIAANDVSISPSRWEGLGLPLYEAVAFGMPQITNDDPPMNEVVVDGVNGLLVPSHPDGTARSGIPARRPDVPALSEAIERLADPELRARLAAGARASQAEHRWQDTVDALGDLLEPSS